MVQCKLCFAPFIVWDHCIAKKIQIPKIHQVLLYMVVPPTFFNWSFSYFKLKTKVPCSLEFFNFPLFLCQLLLQIPRVHELLLYITIFTFVFSLNLFLMKIKAKSLYFQIPLFPILCIPIPFINPMDPSSFILYSFLFLFFFIQSFLIWK
jgi:hypothetical protein